MSIKAQSHSLLRSANISVGQGFGSLNEPQRLAMVDAAKVAFQAKYGRPLPDNSESYIRRRYELLQMRARP